MRFYVGAMKSRWHERSVWFGSVTDKDLRKVMGLLRRQGALTIRDIDDDVLVDKEHLWASRKPSKRALQLAFYRGTVTISQRTGMLKTYELMTRHFALGEVAEAGLGEGDPDLSARPRRCARRGSSAWIRSATSTLRASRASSELIEARVRRGELAAVDIEGRQAALDASRDARRRSRPGREPGAHPVAVRPAGAAAQAAAAVLRLRAPLRGLRAQGPSGCTATSPCRCWSATRSSPPSTSRRTASRASCWCNNGPGSAAGSANPTSGMIEEALHRFERFQLAR